MAVVISKILHAYDVSLSAIGLSMLFLAVLFGRFLGQSDSIRTTNHLNGAYLNGILL